MRIPVRPAEHDSAGSPHTDPSRAASARSRDRGDLRAPERRQAEESGQPWSAIVAVLGAAAAGVGLLGVVTLTGAAIRWLNLDGAGLPADHAVAVTPRSELLVVGAKTLAPLAVILAVSLLMLWLALSFSSEWHREKDALVELPLRLPPGASQADVDVRNGNRRKVRSARRRKGWLILKRWLFVVGPTGEDESTRPVTDEERAALAAKQSRAHERILRLWTLGAAAAGVGYFLWRLQGHEASPGNIVLVAGICVVAAAACAAVWNRLNTDRWSPPARFGWLTALAAFVFPVVVIGMVWVQSREVPRVTPAVYVRSDARLNDGIVALYVAETGSTIYLAQVVPGRDRQRGNPVTAKMMELPRASVRALWVGNPVAFADWESRAESMRSALTETMNGRQLAP